MVEPGMVSGAGVKALPAAVRAIRAAARYAFRAPPIIWAAVLAAGATATFAMISIWGALAGLPGLMISFGAAVALACWLWTTRPSRGRFAVFVSEFAERSTHAHVKAAPVHRHELLSKLDRQGEMAGRLQIRALPPLRIVDAERILVRTSAWAVVLGETVTTGASVKWSASMVYRLFAHSRYAVTTDEGEPAMLLGKRAWTDLFRLRLPLDAKQTLEVLTEEDFPASHAEGVTAMVLALFGTTAEDVDEVAAVSRATRSRWEHAPLPAKALVLASEADVAMITKGWPACKAALRRGVRTVQHPLLQRIFGGYLAVACAHGNENPELWLSAAERLVEMTDGDSNSQYMLGCALMGCGRWSDALSVLQRLRTARFRGRLAPDRREVLAASAQAADLADDKIELDLALRALRKAMTRRLRHPPRRVMYMLAWLQVHNYDGVALNRMQARLDELGRDFDIIEARQLVAHPSG